MKAVRLSWDGKERALLPESSAPPGRTLVAEDGKGLLLHGDNRSGMRALLPDFAGKVTLGIDVVAPLL